MASAFPRSSSAGSGIPVSLCLFPVSAGSSVVPAGISPEPLGFGQEGPDRIPTSRIRPRGYPGLPPPSACSILGSGRRPLGLGRGFPGRATSVTGVSTSTITLCGYLPESHPLVHKIKGGGRGGEEKKVGRGDGRVKENKVMEGRAQKRWGKKQENSKRKPGTCH